MPIEDLVPWTWESREKYKKNNQIWIFRDCVLTKDVGNYEKGDDFYKIVLDKEDQSFQFYLEGESIEYSVEERLILK